MPDFKRQLPTLSLSAYMPTSTTSCCKALFPVHGRVAGSYFGSGHIVHFIPSSLTVKHDAIPVEFVPVVIV